LGGLSAANMMRLGFIVPGGLDHLSGGFLYDRMLVKHLRASGWQVEVLPFHWGSYVGDLLQNLPRTSRGGFDPVSLDLLLEDELSHPALLAFNRRLRRETDVPIIAIVHHLRSSEARPAWMNALYRRVERSYFGDVDGAVCNSLATRRSVEALWADSRPSVVAYPGRGEPERHINAEDIQTRAFRAGPLNLIFLGNIIPRKGLLTLLDALAAIMELDWRLEVVGDLSVDPAHVRRIRRAIRARGLDQRVALAGRLDEASLAVRLAQAQVMVVPATYEGFGIAYLDGMGFGLPAVATAVGGAAELVHHRHNGLLVPPDDTNALARGLAGLMNDRRALSEMGVAALETYRRHPSWSDSAALVRRFLVEFQHKAGQLAMAG